MTASEHYRAGRLQEAIDAQIQEVKAHPGDPGKRLFLFELLAFAGELDRASRQIEAVQYHDVGLDAATAAYRKVLDAEKARRGVFRGEAQPKFLAEPPAHARQRLEALGHLRGQRPAEAAAVLARANEATPALRGRLNDKPFDVLRDCDDLLAGVLEVMAHGDYYWVPLEQIESLTAEAPRSPRDLLWVPAALAMPGAAGNVFLPALYPGSAEHADPPVKLGRITDWHSPAEGLVLGVGARQLLAGDDAVGLLDVRRLVVEHGTPEEGAGGG
jgi:type VI secretion system protein ImpE